MYTCIEWQGYPYAQIFAAHTCAHGLIIWKHCIAAPSTPLIQLPPRESRKSHAKVTPESRYPSTSIVLPIGTITQESRESHAKVTLPRPSPNSFKSNLKLLEIVAKKLCDRSMPDRKPAWSQEASAADSGADMQITRLDGSWWDFSHRVQPQSV